MRNELRKDENSELVIFPSFHFYSSDELPLCAQCLQTQVGSSSVELGWLMQEKSCNTMIQSHQYRLLSCGIAKTVGSITRFSSNIRNYTLSIHRQACRRSLTVRTTRTVLPSCNWQHRSFCNEHALSNGGMIQFTASCTTTHIQPRSNNNDTRSTRQLSTFTKSEYIHPLSQIVLEHLQSQHGDWLKQMGLETGLHLNKDGTFVLRFPSSLSAGTSTTNDEEEGISDTTDSIWTMYEPEEKKHYLCITKNNLIGRYMLQDNTKPAWHSDKRSTPERVQDAVDEMIGKINEVEQKHY